jgi:hypothetical protein
MGTSLRLTIENGRGIPSALLQDTLEFPPILKVGHEKSIQIPPKHLLQNPNPILVPGILELDMHPQRSNRRFLEFPDMTLNLPKRSGHVVMKLSEGIVLCAHEILEHFVGLCDLLNKILLSLSQFLVRKVLVFDLLFEMPDGGFTLADTIFTVFELDGETVGFFLFALTFAVVVFFFLFGLFLGFILFDDLFFLADAGFQGLFAGLSPLDGVIRGWFTCRSLRPAWAFSAVALASLTSAWRFLA